MKASLGKRHLMLAVLVVFLAVAVLVNWYYTGSDKAIKAADSASGEDISNNAVNLGDAIYAGASDVADEYFASAKLSRDQSYDEAVAALNEIIQSSDGDEQSAKTASDSLSGLSQTKIAQTNIENLVKAKTGSDCVAVISGDSANIIVNESIINDDTALQIKEIVLDNADVEADKISIVGAK